VRAVGRDGQDQEVEAEVHRAEHAQHGLGDRHERVAGTPAQDVTALAARTKEIADGIAAEYGLEGGAARDVAETFTAVSVAVIERLRADPELAVLLAPGSPLTLPEALWSDELTERGERFWPPMLEQARAQGLLRTDLSLAELSDWLRTVYTSMILRPDLDPAADREIIQRFVLTSLAMVMR
jgi:hypothetical protein